MTGNNLISLFTGEGSRFGRMYVEGLSGGRIRNGASWPCWRSAESLPHFKSRRHLKLFFGFQTSRRL